MEIEASEFPLPQGNSKAGGKKQILLRFYQGSSDLFLQTEIFLRTTQG